MGMAERLHNHPLLLGLITDPSLFNGPAAPCYQTISLPLHLSYHIHHTAFSFYLLLSFRNVTGCQEGGNHRELESEMMWVNKTGTTSDPLIGSDVVLVRVFSL